MGCDVVKPEAITETYEAHANILNAPICCKN